jgi:glycosyltransferase involved in cell wall biosynthesis
VQTTHHPILSEEEAFPTGPVSGRVLLFVHYNPHSTGSFVDFILGLTAHFAKNNRVIFVIAGPGPVTDKIRALGVEVIIRPFHENDNPVRYLWHCVEFAFTLARLRVDCIFYADYVYWKPAEILSGLLLRIPAVAMIHFYKTAPDFKGFLRRMKRIVPNSSRTAQAFIQHGLGDRVTVILNSIDVVQHQKTGASLRREWAPSNELLVGYVGVLHPIKGIEYFIEAAIEVAQVIPHVKFVIVGNEKFPDWRAHLERLAQPILTTKQLVFAGHRDDIPQVMRSLDILVVPSLEEPFGYVNIEAGAAGVPVIASNVGGIPEIVVDGETGRLVPPADRSAIAGALTELLSSQPLRQALGDAARRRIEQYFSAAARLQEWERLFAAINFTSAVPSRKS